MKKDILFLSVANQETRGETKLMLDSLRTFGGELKDAPFWVFSSEAENVKSLENHQTRVVPLVLEQDGTPYLFERKVTACARAEEMAPAGTEVIAWVDPGVVFTASPQEFLLQPGFDAAFRPVHIRNVGLPPREPQDAFWQGICEVAGVKDVPGTVTSFVDGQEIRTYFNLHAFSIRPGLGLLQEWLILFRRLVHDPGFQSEACRDEVHQIFLFQALLSVLVASRIGTGRVKILPPTYNYPYHLQERIPPGRKLDTLNQAVCFNYEDLHIHPDSLQGIGVDEPLKGWLKHNIGK